MENLLEKLFHPAGFVRFCKQLPFLYSSRVFLSIFFILFPLLSITLESQHFSRKRSVAKAFLQLRKFYQMFQKTKA